MHRHLMHSALYALLDHVSSPLLAAQGGAFAAEGIEQILQGRTEKRQIGGRAGNTFSVATFGLSSPKVTTMRSPLHVPCSQ
jgi:chromodomain-helicase-DNA-binding protein 7